MAQKKKKNTKKASVFGTLIALLLIGLYSVFAPKEFTEQVQTIYQSLTEVIETTENEEIPNGSSLAIYYWDVGQADSTLITCNGKNMLIDAGNNADGNLLVEQLEKMNIQKIDVLVGTHPHEDHIGGLDDVIRHFKIGKIYMPNRESNSKTFEDVLDAVEDNNLKITIPKKGTTFSLGDAKCKILSAESEAEETNDSSIVIEMAFGKQKYLFTGDLTSRMEPNISWEDIDVLKVAHHGSHYSSSEEFLSIVKPEIAIISCGPENEYGHPHQEVLSRLKEAKCKVYRTDKSGTIFLSSDGKRVTIKGLKIFLDGNRK